MTGIFEDGAYGAEHPRIDVNGFHVKRSTPFTRSTPPMAPTCSCHTSHRFDDTCKKTRVVIVEKPFGHLASAQRLNAALHAVLTESRIFRIDHYLGKDDHF